MIVMRNQQMQVFSTALLDDFVKRMVQHLRSDFPQYLRKNRIVEADLDAFVRRGIKAAESFGVLYEGDVQRYVECMAMLGPDFPSDPRFPWAGETLRVTDFDGEAKMNLISEHVTFEVEPLPDE